MGCYILKLSLQWRTETDISKIFAITNERVKCIQASGSSELMLVSVALHY